MRSCQQTVGPVPGHRVEVQTPGMEESTFLEATGFTFSSSQSVFGILCSDLDLGMAELMQSAKRSSSSCPVLSRLSMERSEREELKLLLTFGSFPPLARSVTSDAPVEEPELPDLVSKRHQSTVLKSMDLGTDPTLRSCLNNIYNEFRCKSCTELIEFGCN